MKSLETTLEPYSRIQDLYQTYYRESFSAFCNQEKIPYRENGAGLSGILRFLGRVRNSERFDRFAPARVRIAMLDGIAGLMGAGATVDHAVGKYIYRDSKQTVKICIDAEDSGAIRHPDLFEWSDLYFKTNYWPDREYHRKVLPLANVNPLVLTRREELRACRSQEPQWDLFGFFRVWGRIDHNIALFEALAKLPCRTKLIAYLISGDNAGEIARLEKAGVAWTTSPMPLKELWDLAARSRLNIVRHGVDDCIPWRMTDMLAMGHCPVLDYKARTRWHVPLVENVHYLSLGVPPEDDTVSPEEFGARVVRRIEGWLATDNLIETVAGNAAAYFDEYLEPERFGGYLMEQAGKSLQEH